MRKILVVGKMCMPCRQLKDWLAEHHIELETIVGEDDMQFCRTYNVRQTPSLVIIKDAVQPSTYDTYEVIAGKDPIIDYLEGGQDVENNMQTDPAV